MIRITTATLFLLCAAPLAAQSAVPKPTFEVASIKPADPHASGSTFNTTPGGMTATNWTLKGYVMIAYDLKDYQMTGGPKWADSDCYDIVAKMESTDHPPSGKEVDNQVRAALQALLADRFHLVVHRESKSASGYALVAAGNTLKLKPAAAGGRNSNTWKPGKLTSTSVSMNKLAEVVLSRILGSTVADMTGIKGDFDVTLEWAPEDSRQSPDKVPGPSIFTALQEQLGLKLETRKVSQEVLVIDRAEKPAPN